MLIFPRISSRILQHVGSSWKGSLQEIGRKIGEEICWGQLELGRGFLPLLESYTLEGLTDGDLIIVFSKSLRPSVSTSVE